jgi:hypothetical protein
MRRSRSRCLSLPVSILAVFVIVFGGLGAFSTKALAQNPGPFVNQPLVPDAVAPGGPDFTLTVNGTGFVSGAVVDWNGNPLATQFVSRSQLTATVPAADIATASTALVTVVNPAPGGGRSNLAFLPVTLNEGDAVQFGPPLAAPAGYQPLLVAVGVNGGGSWLALEAIDLCSTWDCYGGGTTEVSTVLGDGTGNFWLESSPFITDDEDPQLTVAGDFNGDGNLDLAVEGGVGGVAILLGNGYGFFSAAPSCGLPGQATAMVVADFNGDGNLDLAAVGYSAGGWVSVLLGDGTGNFSGGSFLSTVEGPNSLTAGDFNEDGKMDLAVAGYPDGVVILLGDGTGNFTLGSPVNAGSSDSFVTAADFDGDGKLDLLVGGDGGGVWLGDGTGKFTSVGGPDLLFGGVVGDFNADGKLDVIGIPGNPWATNLFLGNGDGTFGSPIETGIPPQPNAIRFVGALGDFNNDGRLDVVTPDEFSNTVSIWLQPSAAMLLSPSSLTFANQPDNTTSSKQTVTVSNTGNAPLVIVSIDVSGDFAQTNTCGSPVAVGGSCAISVTFTPTAPGTRTGTISINDNAPRGPQVVSLTGTGLGPAVTLSASTMSVGSQPVGTTSAAHTLTLTNSGGSALTITSVSASGDFAETNTCGGSVAAGARCTISVTFTPTAAGTRTGTITITDNAPGSSRIVSLAGTGMGPAVSFSASTMSAGGAIVGTTSGAHTVTLTNSGNAALTITGMTVSPSSFSESNTCGSSLAAGARCAITVTFTPATAGAISGMLSIADNAPGSPHQVMLTGTGQDFSIGPYNLTQSVPRGVTVLYDLKMAPEGGFNQTVALACSGAPGQSTCSVTPASATLDGRNPAVITLRVVTQGAASAVPIARGPIDPPNPRPTGLPAASLVVLVGSSLILLTMLLATLAAVCEGMTGEAVVRNIIELRADRPHDPRPDGAGSFPRARLRLGVLSAGATLLLITVLWVACGGGGAYVFTPPTGDTPSGNYVLTVTATSGHLSHAVSVRLTVQ